MSCQTQRPCKVRVSVRFQDVIDPMATTYRVTTDSGVIDQRIQRRKLAHDLINIGAI